MFPNTTVISFRQFCKALCGIAENCLRYRQCLPIFQRIMEQVTVQPHQRAGMPILVAFRLTQKVSAVDKYHAIAASRVLCRIFLCNDDRRIILMAGSSPAAANGLTAVRDPCPLKIPLHRMPPAKTDKIILPTHEIQTSRGRLFHTNRLSADVHDLRTPRDNIHLLEHTVQQPHLNATDRILYHDFQRFRLMFPRIHSRKPA